MAILKNVTDRLKGAFKVLVGSAAVVGIVDVIKGYVKEKGLEEGVKIVKELASGKGLLNEAVYGYILGKCKITSDERAFFIGAIEELRAGTEKEKEAANNFVIAIAQENPCTKGSWLGEETLKGIIKHIKSCPTKAEKMQMIKNNIINIGTDVKVKDNVDIVKKWAMDVWTNDIKPVIDQINALSEEYRDSSKKALDDFNKRPLWKKLFLN